METTLLQYNGTIDDKVKAAAISAGFTIKLDCTAEERIYVEFNVLIIDVTDMIYSFYNNL